MHRSTRVLATFLLVAIESVAGVVAASDDVFTWVETSEIYSESDSPDDIPLYARVRFSILSNIDMTGMEITYSALTLVRSYPKKRASALLDEVLDVTRQPYADRALEGSFGIVESGMSVHTTSGLKSPYSPSVKVPIDYTLPHTGFEIFAMPGLDLRKVRATRARNGISSFKSFAGSDPPLDGTWSYRVSELPDGRSVVSGPFLATGENGKLTFAGWLHHQIDRGGGFERSEGHYLLVVSSLDDDLATRGLLANGLERIKPPVFSRYHFVFSKFRGQPVPKELAEHIKSISAQE